MCKSIIILAGGKSRRFQSNDKCISLTINSLPLLQHTINRVKGIADEIIVAAGNSIQSMEIRKRINGDFDIVLDSLNDFGPLSGFLSGLEHASCDFCLIIGCDMPFINPEVVKLMFGLLSASGYDAIVPRWENGMLEPLHSVYRRDPTLAAVMTTVKERKMRISNILARLRVYFVPVARIRAIDSELKTFMNINTPADIGAAKKHKRYYSVKESNL